MRPVALALALLLGCGGTIQGAPADEGDSAPDADRGGSHDAGGMVDGSTGTEAGQLDAATDAPSEAADAAVDAGSAPEASGASPVICRTPQGDFEGCNGASGPGIIAWGSGSCDAEMPGAGGYCPPGTPCTVTLVGPDAGQKFYGTCL